MSRILMAFRTRDYGDVLRVFSKQCKFKTVRRILLPLNISWEGISSGTGCHWILAELHLETGKVHLYDWFKKTHDQYEIVAGLAPCNTAAGDLFDGLQSNLIDHMVSRQPKKIPMVSKMQKKYAWAEMYQNDGLPWIYPALENATMGGGTKYDQSSGAERVGNAEFARSKKVSRSRSGTTDDWPHALGVTGKKA
jgi:hypothetical protein